MHPWHQILSTNQLGLKRVDSIVVSVFVNIGWTNTVSEQKISITILILKRGTCLQEGRGNQIHFNQEPKGPNPKPENQSPSLQKKIRKKTKNQPIKF